MSILQYKYKAHRLVNTLFYVIVFVIGFFLGFGANKIDFNKLINQFLMIENVQAYTIEYDDYSVNEEQIYDQFKNAFIDFDISIYNNIICTIGSFTPYGPSATCYASNENKFILDNYEILQNHSAILNVPEGTSYYRIFYKLSDLSFNSKNYVESHDNSTGNLGFVYLNPEGVNRLSTYSNFYINGLSDELNERLNVLDFNGIDLEFNENLFKDNPDFKEVCVNNYDTFSVTSNQITGIDEKGDNYFKDYDFMFFPYRVNGLTTYIYDTTKENHVYIPENDNNVEDRFLGWKYFFNNKEVIDGIYDKDNPGNYLKQKGYTDKYSYYGYMVVPIEMDFRVDKHYYPVFWFKDPYIEFPNGTRRLDSEKYCFYIKNEYDVNILNHDSMGDVYGDITILGGTTSSESTSLNKDGLDNSTLLNTLYSLLTRLRSTIDFVNYHIELFFFSLPLMLQMFIISVILIFTLKLIINMIVR